MKFVVVYNPTSGSAQTEHELREKFTGQGHIIEEFVPLNHSLGRNLKSFIAAGRTIAVVGGDGTLNAVAQCMVGTKAVLAPLPGGTLNHFAKDVGVQEDLDDAIEQLSKSKVHLIDVASVEGRFFLNNSSIGLYPSSLVVRDRLEAKWGKWPAAVIAAFRIFIYLRPHRLLINGEEVMTPFVFVGNNAYHLDRLGVAERKEINEGILSVFVAKTVSRWTLLKIALFSLVGRAHNINDFDVYKTTTLKVSGRRRLSVSYDGEVDRMSSVVEYKACPRALKVRY